MLNRIMKAMVECYNSLSGSMATGWAILITVGAFILGLGIGFAISLGIAWVFMMVYNTLANSFDLPKFSIWFWFGVTWILGLCMKMRRGGSAE